MPLGRVLEPAQALGLISPPMDNCLSPGKRKSSTGFPFTFEYRIFLFGLQHLRTLGEQKQHRIRVNKARIASGKTTAATIFVFSVDDSCWFTVIMISIVVFFTMLEAMHWIRCASPIDTSSIMSIPSLVTEYLP